MKLFHLVLVSIIVIGCTLDPAPDRSEIKGGDRVVSSIIDEAISSQDTSPCNRIKGDLLQANCIGEVAASLDRFSLCDNLTEKGEDICRASIAYKKGEIELCRTIRSDTILWQCVYFFSSASLDPTGCEIIEDQDQTVICKDMVDRLRQDVDSLCNRSC